MPPRDSTRLRAEMKRQASCARLARPSKSRNVKVSNYLPKSFRRKGTKPKRLVPNRRSDEGSGVALVLVVAVNVESGPTSEKINEPSVVEKPSSGLKSPVPEIGPMAVVRPYVAKAEFPVPNMPNPSSVKSTIPACDKPWLTNDPTTSSNENVPMPLIVTVPGPTFAKIPDPKVVTFDVFPTIVMVTSAPAKVLSPMLPVAMSEFL